MGTFGYVAEKGVVIKKRKGIGNQQHVKLTAEHKEGLDSDKGMVEVRL